MRRAAASPLPYRALPAISMDVRRPDRSIAETEAEMKESACRFPGHARITICRSRYHAFEQTEYASHFRHSVKCGNYMHFRGARVAEAGVNPPGNQRANQTRGPVHCCFPLTFPSVNSFEHA